MTQYVSRANLSGASQPLPVTAGSGPSASSAARPGSCTQQGWRDAPCSAIDPGCGLGNVWGAFSCGAASQLRKAGYGLQILFGFTVLAAGVAVIASQTSAGRQLGQEAAKTAKHAITAALLA